MTRDLPPIRWPAVLIGGAVAVGLSAGLSMGSQTLPGPAVVALGVAAGALLAGRLAGAASAFHGGLVAVLWIAAEAIAEPLRAAAGGDVVADLAQTILSDVIRLAVGVLFGWLGGRLR